MNGNKEVVAPTSLDWALETRDKVRKSGHLRSHVTNCSHARATESLYSGSEIFDNVTGTSLSRD